MSNFEATDKWMDGLKDDLVRSTEAYFRDSAQHYNRRKLWREIDISEGRKSPESLDVKNDFDIYAWRTEQLNSGFLDEDRIESLVRYWKQQVEKYNAI